MFDTPQEAALKAENERLRSENAWLRNAVEAPGSSMVTPYGVEEDMQLREPLRDVRLPLVGGVRGKLQLDGRWAVVGWQDRIANDRLEVGYYTDGYRTRHIDDMTFVNHILPKCHERFIRTLADIFVKQRKP